MKTTSPGDSESLSMPSFAKVNLVPGLRPGLTTIVFVKFCFCLALSTAILLVTVAPKWN